MKPILIILALLLTGCNSMTNDEAIKEIKKCRDNNLSISQYINPFSNTTRAVVCYAGGNQ